MAECLTVRCQRSEPVTEQCANIYPQLCGYCLIILSANRTQRRTAQKHRKKQAGNVFSQRLCLCACGVSNRADVSTLPLQLSPLVPSRHTAAAVWWSGVDQTDENAELNADKQPDAASILASLLILYPN